MATRYSRIGDTSMNNPESHDTDSDSQDNYQEDIHDQKNIEPNHLAGLKHLTCKIEQLRQAIKDNDNDPMDAINHLEQKLNQLAITLCPPTEPTGEVLNKYTKTLCTTQKKTSLESSLLQDIPILNGNNSSQLGDWLTDIETASELMGESRTKLGQAKSKGLVRTLISEALTLNTTWDDIKDSLCLKICNSDIHMSISHFMDIQQKKKESLAAYIHHFKREASRCKFDNDSATIRIFIKGLRNAHTLATRVYEKGPQCLADAIKEVEKLQAAQQLTSTLLPSSSVNTISSDEDKCFQCQESGHMACYCPRIRCFDCDDYGHVATDCPDKIPPSGVPARHRDNNSHKNDGIDPHPRIPIMIGTITVTSETGIGLAGPNPIHTAIDTVVTLAVTHEEVTLDPTMDLHTAVHHITEAQAHTVTDVTPHTADPYHTEVFPETAVDPDHIHCTNTTTKHQQDHHLAPIKQPGKPKT